MSFNQGLLIIMGIGALLGGGDHLLGNRFGLGQRFEEAFQLLGLIALSMSGIICLAPLLSAGLSGWMVPLFRGLGLDPGMFGGILPIDMGGYQLAVELADRELVGKFSGILVAATFGCTLIFTIPVGLGTIPEEDRPLFTRGILLGLLSLPAGLLLGGWSAGSLLGCWQSIFCPFCSAAAAFLQECGSARIALRRFFSGCPDGFSGSPLPGLRWQPSPISAAGRFFPG